MKLSAPPVLPLLALALLTGCQTTAAPQGGHAAALAPILGGRGLGAPIPRTRASEPVEDYWIDLLALAPAWPEARADLPRLLESIVARGSWTDEHHVAEATDGAVHVRHRPEVVAEVRRLVEGLRARLLTPLQIQLVLAELDVEALDRLAPGDSTGERRWQAGALRAAAGRGEARVLARTILSGYNGQWAVSDRVSNQARVVGVNVVDGSVSPRTITLASGFTIQAAAWRWGEDRAVVALTGLYTGEAMTSNSLGQTVHRELPRRKKNEQEWEEHEVKLELPVRDLVELRSQLTVSRGEWSLAALLPRDRKHVCAALLRVDWSSPVAALPPVSPLSPRGYSLEIIPVALPTESPAPALESTVEFDNRRDLSANAAGWFKGRAKLYQESQKKNTYNFQAESSSVDLAINPAQRFRSNKSFQSRGRSEESRAAGLMPEALEQLRDSVLLANWPEGTALEFSASHLFVVHDAELIGRLRSLIAQTQVWRNRRVLVEVAFPVLSAGIADELKQAHLGAERAAALRRGETQLPAAYLVGRRGSRTEIFVGEMHAALSDAWPPDRSSPPVWVYWRGARLGVEPQLGAGTAQAFDLGWQQHRLDRLGAAQVAGAIVQQPQDSLWKHQQTLRLEPGQSVLTAMSGEGSKLQALLVGAQVR